MKTNKDICKYCHHPKKEHWKEDRGCKVGTGEGFMNYCRHCEEEESIK